MKYPYSRWYWFWCQTVCFFLGHKWKIAPRRPSQYYEMEEQDVPYDYRKRSGNYMFENITWWTGKCVRCRHKERDNDPWHVWHQTFYWAIKDAFRSTKWMTEYVFTDEYGKKALLWRRVAFLLLALPAKMWLQFAIHFERVPSTWWEWAADVEYWCFVQMDKGRCD
jgi:hypothetical protein